MHRVWSITLAHCIGTDGSIIGFGFRSIELWSWVFGSWIFELCTLFACFRVGLKRSFPWRPKYKAQSTKTKEPAASLVPLDGPAFFLPQLKATEECCYILVTLRFHGARRTGRRLFP